MKTLISLLLSLVFAVTLFAQQEDVTVETDLPTTLLRAEELLLPDYPEIAKNPGLRGRVSVNIILDAATVRLKPIKPFIKITSQRRTLKRRSRR